MKTTHIVSTDLKRPVSEIVKDIEAKGFKVVRVLNPIKAIFVNVPTHLNAQALRNIKGVVAAGPNRKIRAC